jgi:hypothetical protein
MSHPRLLCFLMMNTIVCAYYGSQTQLCVVAFDRLQAICQPFEYRGFNHLYVMLLFVHCDNSCRRYAYCCIAFHVVVFIIFSTCGILLIGDIFQPISSCPSYASSVPKLFVDIKLFYLFATIVASIILFARLYKGNRYYVTVREHQEKLGKQPSRHLENVRKCNCF